MRTNRQRTNERYEDATPDGTLRSAIGFINIASPACTSHANSGFYEMSRNIAFAVLLLMGFGVSACNTVAGAGQDIENTGDAIQDEANEAR